jgi:hypothetical protein
MRGPLSQVTLREGLRSGAILSLCAVALAVLGLTPALSWIPEVPLIGGAIVLPLAILVWTGVRVARRSSRLVAGPLASALAGAIGGCVGGIAYLVAGKPSLNVIAGLLGGALSGAVFGFAGAILAKRLRAQAEALGRGADERS